MRDDDAQTLVIEMEIVSLVRDVFEVEPTEFVVRLNVRCERIWTQGLFENLWLE